jgi:DNA-binding CsgD family transcriptional regulator/tetratricopeptide (TPR) repeat protein
VAPDAHRPASDQPIQKQLVATRSSQGQPFVGRESELRQLGAAFEAAAGSGDGRLIMLVGEPGIGKTALCEQLTSFVSTRNGRRLVGHCYPEGSAGVPYQPFVEAFEAFARQRDAEALRAELGSSAGEVARMVPALRSRLQVELSAPENPEDDRLRLLSGILDCLRNIGAAQPLLLVLEDLHDADRGTLDLLVYLARHLAGTPLLVVGTYRDVEVDRAHPLAAALAELRRGSQFDRVHLSELSVDEVQRLLASSSQQAVPRALAEQVHHRSGGNALFVHELLRFLLSEGLVEQRGGVLRRVGEETSLAGQMPEGLRDAVGKRLSRLSEGTNRVLSVASVIGREFQLDVLSLVFAGPEEELEAALEEASAAGIIEEHSAVGASIMYRFGHAFFRQTLYDEIVAPRRIRLHQQVARALKEVYARRLEEHAAELAEHYAFSSETSDLSKAVDYAMLAAARAAEVFAYGEAARQLERALALQDLVDPTDQVRRCDLLLKLGEALHPAGEYERVIRHVAPDAQALAGDLHDDSRAFRACRLALSCLYAQGAGFEAAQPEYLTWAERAGQYASPDSVERIHADLALAQTRFPRGQFGEARALRLEALALARRLADPEALFSSAWHLLQANAPQHWDEFVRLAEEAARWQRDGVSGRTLGSLLYLAGRVQLAQGERVRAEELWRQMEDLAGRTHVVEVSLMVHTRDTALAIVDGNLEEAVALNARFIERANESGATIRGRLFGLRLLIAPVLYLGRPEIWLNAFNESAGPAELDRAFVITAPRAMCLAQLGRVEEARTLVGPLLDQEGSGDDEIPIGFLVILLQAAVVLEHRPAAQALAARLASVAHLANAEQFYTCVGRHLGDAAKLVDDRAAARMQYTEALETAEKIRFRPEVALAHLGLAELLLKEGDELEALEHLDLAIPELRDMKMQPALGHGLSLLEQVQHRTPVAASDAHISHVLTGCERDVARLLAAGRSNREIADTLVITEGTVEVHVKHILSKLGLKSRAQVAAWAADERL